MSLSAYDHLPEQATSPPEPTPEPAEDGDPWNCEGCGTYVPAGRTLCANCDGRADKYRADYFAFAAAAARAHAELLGVALQTVDGRARRKGVSQ